MFYESCFIAAACALEPGVINPNYINGKTCKTDPPVSAMKYRLDFLFFVDINLCSYRTMHE